MFQAFTVEQVTLFVIVLLGVIAVLSAILSYINKSDEMTSDEWWSGYWQGLSTEMFGAILTGLLFTFIVGTAANVQEDRELRAQLIAEMGSATNIQSLSAVQLLRLRGWHADGSLREADFLEADLQDANLSSADMAGAFFPFADLRNADLTAANLRGARLNMADLSGANMLNTNLQNADLSGADLSGAILTNANLTSALLENALFTEETILPDNEPWTPDTDLSQFTGG